MGPGSLKLLALHPKIRYVFTSILFLKEILSFDMSWKYVLSPHIAISICCQAQISSLI